MKLDDADRIAPPRRPARRSAIAVFAIAAVVIAILVGAMPALRDGALQQIRQAGVAAGVVQSPRQTYAETLKRFGIDNIDLPALSSAKVTASLERLGREKCDRQAIFALSEGLHAAGEHREAAYALFGFAATCPNGENEEFRAAQILLGLGDHARTIEICDDLVRRNPAIADYRYVRAKALAAAARYQDALVDYRSAIELRKDPRLLNERFFVEMANVFAALGQGCNAAKTIFAWVAMDPQKRGTPQARKMIQEYAGQDCPMRPGGDDARKL